MNVLVSIVVVVVLSVEVLVDSVDEMVPVDSSLVNVLVSIVVVVVLSVEVLVDSVDKMVPVDS